MSNLAATSSHSSDNMMHNRNGDLEKHHGGQTSHLEHAPPLKPMLTPGGHVTDTSQPGFPVYHRKFGDPAPLGLMSFGIATLINALYTLNTHGIKTANVMVGVALFTGGLNTILAGMWEFVQGNTFAATTFTSYGAFYLSFGIAQWPSSGIQTAFLYDPSTSKPWASQARTVQAYGEVGNAIAIWLFSWMILSIIFTFGSFKSNWVLVVMFTTVSFQFLFNGLGYLRYVQHLVGGEEVYFHTAGAFGVITAVAAFYIGLASLVSAPGTTYFRLPVFQLGGPKPPNPAH